jgi:hypothetical protein
MKEPLRVQTLQESFEIAQDHVVELRRTLEPVIQSRFLQPEDENISASFHGRNAFWNQQIC